MKIQNYVSPHTVVAGARVRWTGKGLKSGQRYVKCFFKISEFAGSVFSGAGQQIQGFPAS